MLSSSTSCFPSFDISSPHSCVFPPSPMHMEYQDVYRQFLQLFCGEDQATRPRPRPAAQKKDRHSKINTARGPRDRRMRLSLDIAKRFFHLQDLLGYEKASTTVQWLLTNAAAAIADLPACAEQSSEHDAKICSSRSRSRSRRREKVKRVAVGRESRRKARERARERTSQKRRLIQEEMESSSLLTNYNHHYSSFFTQGEQMGEFQFGASHGDGGKPSTHFIYLNN